MSTGVCVIAEKVVDFPTFGLPTSPIRMVSPLAMKRGLFPQGDGVNAGQSALQARRSHQLAPQWYRGVHLLRESS